MSLGSACWGTMNLLRETGREDFTDDELAFVDDVSPLIAQGLRRAVLTGGMPTAHDATSAAVILLDGDGRVTSMTETAATLMEELNQLPVHKGGFPLPAEAYIVCARARAQAAGRDGPEPTARVQARSGGWLTLRGECTLDHRGDVAATALVVEASRNTDVLPLFVAAHGLSQREEEIVSLLAQGRATREIAAELFISVHTVRDHVKSIFEKVGVGSRGELMSELFHLHYQPDMATVRAVG
ncbi:MAG: LuxR C-terminal-related transcriptional regulator [Egibacteraceae bacterium]